MSKQAITNIIKDELPENHRDKNTPTEKLMFNWWVTGRTGRGYRLTDRGYQAFIDADIQTYRYSLNLETLINKLNNMKAKDLTLMLGRKIKCPWYIIQLDKKTCEITIFDSKIAVMINLYGKLEDYLTLQP